MPYKDPEKRREYHRLYQAKRYQADPIAGAARVRTRRQANPERAREDVRRWRAANPEKVAECNRRWHREHPEAKIRFAKNRPFSKWAMESNQSHRQRSFSVFITTKELADLAEKIPTCRYCGIELDYRPLKGKRLENSATVDRLNNESELHLGNIQIICMACNRRKRKRTHSEFLEYFKVRDEIRA